MIDRRIARRDFLKGAGALRIAGLAWPLAACVPPGGAPRAVASIPPAVRRGATPIKHVIVDVQENRSFDHYYGFAPFAGSYGVPPGYSQPDGSGGFVAPHHLTNGSTPDIAHTWAAMDRAFDSGKMDGFYEANGLPALVKFIEAVFGLPTLASVNHRFDSSTPGGPDNEASNGEAVGPPAPPRDGSSAIGSLLECFTF